MKRIDHIAIAVSDLDVAEALYRDVLGFAWEGREEVSSQKVVASIFRVGDSRVELIAPAADNSPISRFLAQKGPGLHHICFQVDDLGIEVTRLRGEGVQLLDDAPREGVGGSRVAFLHPKSSAGVLIELVQK